MSALPSEIEVVPHRVPSVEEGGGRPIGPAEPAGLQEVFVEAFDGVHLRVHHSKIDPAKASLVVVPPLATTHRFVERATARLARIFNVITWEARLVLEPAAPLRDDGALSVDAHVRDATSILDHLGVAEASLLGYCSGAAVALHVAARTARVRRLALVSGAYFTKADACAHTQYEKDVHDLVPELSASPARARDFFGRYFATPSPRRATHEFGEEVHRAYASPDTLHRFALGLRHLMQGDSVATARRIQVPTLVYATKRDDQTHYANSELVAQALPAGRLHLADEGDHYELCRAAPELLRHVVSFLSHPR